MKKLFRKNAIKTDHSIYERLVGLDAYYQYNHDLIAFFERFLSNLHALGFSVTTVIDKGEEMYEAFCRHIDLEKVTNGLIIKDEFSPEVVFYFPRNHDIISISLWFEFEAERLKMIEDRLIKHKNLIYASLYSQYDNKWQNEMQIQAYEANNKSIQGMKFTNDIFDKKCIDISYNYGRTIKSGAIGYIAGYKMWFGNEFRLLSRSQLNLIPAIKKTQIEYNILEIQLFDKLISDNYEKARDSQKAFIELIQNNQIPLEI